MEMYQSAWQRSYDRRGKRNNQGSRLTVGEMTNALSRQTEGEVRCGVLRTSGGVGSCVLVGS